MCGLAGVISAQAGAASAERLSLMALPLRHRGPDSQDIWYDDTASVGLAHRRLSIVDLSDAGAQPMVSASGRYVLAYNGEIYNHQSLRESLAHEPGWRGYSDTESLLRAIEAWGVASTLARSRGMFALALWDRLQGTMTLARDRFGEKPLYYGEFNGTLLFGSELKALEAHPQFDANIDKGALVELLRRGFISGARSIYRNVRQLAPGMLVEVRPGQSLPKPRAYWSVNAAFEDAAENPFEGGYSAAVNKLEGLLSDAVGSQLEADVPLGSFLSGGIDSSTVCALAQRQLSLPLRTFSIGFQRQGYDEAGHAAAVAQHLGTDHTELYVGDGEARDLVPDLMRLYDQPFADASALPTTLLARMTREHVTVALSGDGGDELFGGYNRYLFGASLWRRVSRLPLPVRRTLARALCALPTQRWDQLLRSARVLPLIRKLPERFGNKLHKSAAGMQAADFAGFYEAILRAPGPDLLQTPQPGSPIRSGGIAETQQVEHALMLADLCCYLPDDVLVKVDRAAMSASLETRVPMLDADVATFALSLPLEYKISKGVGKRVLRDVAYRHVPKSLLDRPKAGFDVPIGEWLRGGLQDWADSQLSPQRLSSEGYFNFRATRDAWVDHVRGKADHADTLWPVLMFQSWLADRSPSDSRACA